MPIYARGGYLEHKTRSPLSLGAAVAINGAVVGALLLANPSLVTEAPKIFTTIAIEKPPPPDPIEPAKPREPVKQVRSVPTQSKSPVVDPEINIVRLPLPPLPPFNPGTGDIGIERVIAPPRAPVFIGPQIDARYRDALQPPYPPGKIRSQEEGVVVVRVRIGADGRVKEVQKVEAADDAFYRATVEQAMKRWRFKPATSDGAPVEGWRTMTVRFELEG